MDINKVLDDLVASLKPSDPYKIVVFGSYANGTPNEHSDIDIMVILNNDHISKNYEERLKKKVNIRKMVLEINRKVPLDILVYSKKEFAIAKNYNNYFFDEIEKTGRVIYEKTG
jgi:predicted nucleotidyltransferase